MLAINPEECIDCGVCEPECPADAIEPETDENVKWLEMNREYSAKWPNITVRNDALPDADAFKDEKDKFDKYFSDKPGAGS